MVCLIGRSAKSRAAGVPASGPDCCPARMLAAGRDHGSRTGPYGAIPAAIVVFQGSWWAALRNCEFERSGCLDGHGSLSGRPTVADKLPIQSRGSSADDRRRNQRGSPLPRGMAHPPGGSSECLGDGLRCHDEVATGVEHSLGQSADGHTRACLGGEGAGSSFVRDRWANAVAG